MSARGKGVCVRGRELIDRARGLLHEARRRMHGHKGLMQAQGSLGARGLMHKEDSVCTGHGAYARAKGAYARGKGLMQWARGLMHGARGRVRGTRGLMRGRFLVSHAYAAVAGNGFYGLKPCFQKFWKISCDTVITNRT